jgi:CheY-like chemotaxis protein
VSAQDQSLVLVLVVDDSDVAQHALCAVVAETPGFEVVGVASSGREALYLLRSIDRPLLVLLDVLMPGMDSIETARRIRTEHPDVVVVLVTASPQTSDDPSLVIEDRRDVSPRWLADLWRRHSPRVSPPSR